VDQCWSLEAYPPTVVRPCLRRGVWSVTKDMLFQSKQVCLPGLMRQDYHAPGSETQFVSRAG
jgi:hypothetical protein